MAASTSGRDPQNRDSASQAPVAHHGTSASGANDTGGSDHGDAEGSRAEREPHENAREENASEENASEEYAPNENAVSAGSSEEAGSDGETEFDTPLPNVDVTRLLRKARDGSDTAREELFRLTYDELRSMAERELRKRHSGGTLSVTSVVNRAYLRLVDDEEGRISTYANRLHFFGTAARAMRSAIIDYARYKTRQKRGGDQADLALEDVLSPEAEDQPLETLLTVESALQQLEAMDPDLARVVELIFFGGMLQREVAELEDIDVRTVQRRWRKAKLILRDFLTADGDVGE